ncbi:hypothetical protein E6C60_0606 [Paenibacillus algicola]|uniref:Uncharacterized protein n=1 Tax=Paenibacillus algicola TaxID=2565926 RepID=A0A4P8XM74_9BACL|nr:hypothetical protein E6C60_0606 [Paenibacillus algicola]
MSILLWAGAIQYRYEKIFLFFICFSASSGMIGVAMGTSTGGISK